MNDTKPAPAVAGRLDRQVKPLLDRLRGRMNATKWGRGLDFDYATAWEPDALCQEAANELERLTSERDALSAFAAAVMEAWPIGDIDGGTLQDEAVKHGLLAPEVRMQPCAEDGCNCAGYYTTDEWAEGVTCYRRTALLRTNAKLT